MMQHVFGSGEAQAWIWQLASERCLSWAKRLAIEQDVIQLDRRLGSAITVRRDRSRRHALRSRMTISADVLAMGWSNAQECLIETVICPTPTRELARGTWPVVVPKIDDRPLHAGDAFGFSCLRDEHNFIPRRNGECLQIACFDGFGHVM
jgi:hypothetical protein